MLHVTYQTHAPDTETTVTDPPLTDVLRFIESAPPEQSFGVSLERDPDSDDAPLLLVGGHDGRYHAVTRTGLGEFHELSDPAQGPHTVPFLYGGEKIDVLAKVLLDLPTVLAAVEEFHRNGIIDVSSGPWLDNAAVSALYNAALDSVRPPSG